MGRPKNCTSALAGVLALALAQGGPALAQSGAATSPSLPPPLPSVSQPDTNVVVDSSRVYGDDSGVFFPLSVLGGFGLDIGASLVTRYSDNLARNDPDDPLPPRLVSRSDWSFEPAMTVSGRRPLGRQAVFFNLAAGKRFYTRNTRLNRERLEAGGGLQWQMGGRCGGTVQGGWSQQGTQLGSFLDVVPSRTTRTRASANASCSTATGLSANIGVDFSKVGNTVDDDYVGPFNRRLADVHSKGVSGGLGYRLSNRGEVGIQGQWRRSTFPNRLLPNGESSGNTITGMNGFAKYNLGRSLSAHGSLGFSKVEQAFGAGSGFSGTVWEAGLDYAGPRIGANISTGRSVNGSSGGFYGYSVSKFVVGNVSYRANSRLSGSAGFSHRSNDLGETIFNIGQETIDNRTMDRYFVGADYRMNRILSFSLDYRHQRMRTNLEQYRYRENSVVFGVRANL